MVEGLHGCRLTGSLPPGWRIEVSKIAEAFGQPGGGIQVLVLDRANEPMPVAKLLKKKVLQ